MALHLEAERDLAHAMGLTAQNIERRLKLVGFSPDDNARLARVRSVIEEHAAELTETFLAFLSSVDEARDFLRNREAFELVKKLKQEHLRAMVQGSYGREYAEERVRLGLIYGRAGLETRVILGAFQQTISAAARLIMTKARSSNEGAEDFGALQKIASFDIALIVDVMVYQRERTILQQQESIRELSTPVLQLRDRLLMLPIIGMIDSHRARMLTEGLLQSIRTNRARVVVMDVTGVAAVDTKVANHLLQTVSAAKLMGATVIVTGLSAEVAQTLVNLGVDLGRLRTIGDLQGGIEEAERLIGYQVVKAEAPAIPSSSSVLA